MSSDKAPAQPTEFDQGLSFATQMHVQGKHDVALNLYKELMTREPNHPYLNYAMGTLFADREDYGMAMPLLMRAVELDPQNHQAWNNLGAVFKSCFRHEEAVQALEAAQRLNPRNSPTYANWSGVYINEGCPEKCIPIAEEGLRFEPTSPQLHNHMALALLEMGEWRKAWPHWENRVNLPGWFQRVFPAPSKPWHGQKTKVLALSGEQGIGDEVMFATIIPEVLPLCEQLLIECTERLQPLFERSFPGCRTYRSHHEMLIAEPRIDHYLQLGSLPRLFRPDPQSCPGTPYLKTDPALVAEFRERLARLGPPPYVGLAWRGGTKKTHEHVRRVPLSGFQAFRDVPGATYVSVQYGKGTALEAAKAGLPHWVDSVDINFDREAAFIDALDLVISVCQSAVHLAGAIGTECWCITPNKPAWRYGLSHPTSMYWYNSVKLYRQTPEEADWKPCLSRAAADLETWITEFHAKETTA